MKSKIFVLGVIGAVFLVPAFVTAQDAGADIIAKLKLEIASLQDRVKYLEERLAKYETVAPPPTFPNFGCNVPGLYLKLGARGDDVKKLQEFLSSQEDVYPSKLVTGFYGPMTAEAVRKFQSREGIESVGVVGPKTIARMKILCLPVIPPGANDIKATVPSTFVLQAGAKAHLGNYRMATLKLESVETIYCITTPCAGVSAQITLHVPGGCGMNADPRCLGMPEYKETFRISLGETINKAGLNVKLTNVQDGKGTFEVWTDEKPVSVSVSVGKKIYSVGEAIPVSIVATNPNNKAITLNFNTGCQISHAIKGVYDYEKVMLCTQALTSVTIPAGGSKEWQLNHTQEQYKLTPGIYTLIGRVIGYGEASAQIQVQ